MRALAPGSAAEQSAAEGCLPGGPAHGAVDLSRGGGSLLWQRTEDRMSMGAAIAIGIAAGSALGVASGNIALGVGLGVAVGVALGAALGRRG